MSLILFSALALLAVKNHAVVELVVYLSINRLLNDAIAKTQSHDEPLFRFLHIKLPVPARLVGAPDHVVLYANQIFLQICREGRHVSAVPFAAAGLAVRLQKIVSRVYSLQKGRSLFFLHVFPLTVSRYLWPFRPGDIPLLALLFPPSRIITIVIIAHKTERNVRSFNLSFKQSLIIKTPFRLGVLTLITI